MGSPQRMQIPAKIIDTYDQGLLLTNVHSFYPKPIQPRKLYQFLSIILLEVKKIPTELLCGLGDVCWEAESTK